MKGYGQFSLSWMLIQILVLGLALGFSRLFAINSVLGPGDMQNTLALIGLAGGITCWGAFFGGFFGKVVRGVAVAWGLFLFWLVFLAPKVQ
jgi:hypothetical protein